MSVCLIPARGGSRRIPRKNIREFCGRPMIGWSIRAAKAARCFGRIIVSTDDAEIAGIARGLGAETPFVRPDGLSDDHATTADVVRHALQWLEAGQRLPKALCCLYATAPFVQADDIVAGAQAIRRRAFAIPVTTFAYPVQRAVKITDAGGLEMFEPDQYGARSQDLEAAYHDAGQFYWGRSAAWLDGTPPFGPDTHPIILPRWRVQDIDTPEDWTRAEAMFRALGLDRHRYVFHPV